MARQTDAKNLMLFFNLTIAPGGFDDGDCLEFNEKYPDCEIPIPNWVGDVSLHE